MMGSGKSAVGDVVARRELFYFIICKRQVTLLDSCSDADGCNLLFPIVSSFA